MNVDEQIKELMEKKRELERQIRELKNEAIQNDRCKLAYEHYSGPREDVWYVAINCINIDDREYSFRSRSVIRGADRDEVISKIPEVIEGLQDLYERLTK